MTAEEWDTTTDYQTMYAAVLGYQATGRTKRKCYCFALACLRRMLWDRLSPTAREVAETVERFVEGKVPDRERARARALLRNAPAPAEQAVYWAACSARDIKAVAYSGTLNFVEASVYSLDGPLACEDIRPNVLRLMREIFPNPHRQFRIDPAWLRWSQGAVRRIAETINDEGDFSRVGVLADALEDAGCDDERMLAHLRSPGPHVRGCWVVDLVLGKE